MYEIPDVTMWGEVESDSTKACLKQNFELLSEATKTLYF
jgi:hypothetical protein